MSLLTGAADAAAGGQATDTCGPAARRRSSFFSWDGSLNFDIAELEGAALQSILQSFLVLGSQWRQGDGKALFVGAIPLSDDKSCFFAAFPDPMMGSPLWALANSTPPAPDLQQSAAAAQNNQQLAARSHQELLPSPGMQPHLASQLSWDHNNMQVGDSNYLSCLNVGFRVSWNCWALGHRLRSQHRGCWLQQLSLSVVDAASMPLAGVVPGPAAAAAAAGLAAAVQGTAALQWLLLRRCPGHGVAASRGATGNNPLI